jgi:putative peptidoglycan lipid II flippase
MLAAMKHKLFRSTSIVALMTMISRLMGFARDVITATIFGAGPAFDAFVIAFKIPNFLRRLFGEGAFAQAFVPVLAEYRTKRSHEEVQAFINYIAGCLGFSLLVVVAVSEIIAPLIVMVFAPGFVHDPLRFHYATHMIRITFPYLILIALTAFAGAALNTFNRFAMPAFTPVILNVVLILVAWFWAPHASVPIYVLAWGVIIGGVLQLAAQIPSMRRLKITPIPKWNWRDAGVLRVMKLMVPALFGVSVAQLSLLIDNFFASFLPVGSISWLYYSDRFTYLPLGVIGVALATVVLPNLSRHHSAQSPQAYSATLDWALRMSMLIGIPAAVALFTLSGPLLATLIHHGAFNVHDVLMTRRSLWAFSVGLPGFMLIKILASAFYSKQNIRTPVKIAAACMGVNLILNLIFIHPLAHAGLALSTSLASLLNALLLLFLLLRRDIYHPQPKWIALIARIIFANAAMGIAIVWYAGDLQRWIDWTLWQRAWHLAAAVVLGMMIYILA